MTQKELLAIHRVHLNTRWKEKYPRGCFTIQRWNDHTGLYWVNKRPTGAAKPFGVGVEENTGRFQNEPMTIRSVDYQNNCFGKVNHYTSYNNFLVAALKFGISRELEYTFARNLLAAGVI